MRRRTRRDLAKEKFWRHAIERWRQSGLSQYAFCDQEDLTPATFSSWKEIIRQRDEEENEERERAEGIRGRQTTFAPVSMVTDAAEAISHQAKPVAELRIQNLVVLIFAGADRETLQSLLTFLKEVRQ